MSLGTNSVLDTIAHPDLLPSLERAYPATVVIQTNTPTQNADGQLIDSWSELLTADCIFAMDTKVAAENRLEPLTIVTAKWRLDMQGYYPTVTVEHRAVVTAGLVTIECNIMRVNHDSQAQSTRLELERVEH